jgi:hypothetical protein
MPLVGLWLGFQANHLYAEPGVEVGPSVVQRHIQPCNVICSRSSPVDASSIATATA